MYGKASLREAFTKQCNATPQRQHNAVRRMEWFGATEDAGGRAIALKIQRNAARRLYQKAPQSYARRKDCGVCALYAHLMDQADWGMLSCEEAITAGRHVLSLMDMGSSTEIAVSDPEDCIKMTNEFIKECSPKSLPLREI